MTDSVAELISAMAEQEQRVLSLLLSYRTLATPIVTAAGLEMRHFSQEDQRLVFAGWLVACEDNLSIVQTLSLIRRALKADGFWDNAVPAGSMGMKHSDATLARMACVRFTEEELDELTDRGPEDGLRRSIARHVTALVDSAEAVEVWTL